MNQFKVLTISVAVLVALGLSQECLGCRGIRCSEGTYCEGDDTNGVCVYKKNLTDSCNGEDQCFDFNSECKNLACQCKNLWTPGPNNEFCIVACNGETGTGCSKGQYCSTSLRGCLPQVDLNNACTVTEESEKQCKTLNAICNEDICVCETDFYAKGDLCIEKCTASNNCGVAEYCEKDSGKCEPKKYLSETCTDSDECATINSGCVDGKCDCTADFVNYLDAACLPKCSDNKICREDEYCHRSKAYCVKKSNLNQPCDSESEGQCSDANAECSTEKCLCKSGFLNFNGQCVEYCEDSGACSADEFCNSAKACEKRRGLSEHCSSPDECIEENGGKDVDCGNGFCICASKFYQVGKNCEPECSTNTDCGDPNNFCDKVMKRCTPKIDLNGLCNPENENSCKTVNANCNVERCTCDPEFVADAGNCISKCSTNNDCVDFADFCDSKTGGCEKKLNLTETCNIEESNMQCTDPNALCIDVPSEDAPICACKTEYAENDQICVSRCSTSDICNSTQYCDANNDESNICKTKIPLERDCEYEDQCAPEHSECDLQGSKVCRCSSNFYNYRGICRENCSLSGCSDFEFCSSSGECLKKKPLGSQCSAASECKTDSAVCDGECRCPANFNQINDLCIEKCTKTTVCDKDSQYCSVYSGLCYSKAPLNQSCTEVDQCLGKLVDCAPNANKKICSCISNAVESGNGRCGCLIEFIENGDSSKCLKKATQIGEDCEESEQCHSLGSDENGEEATICNDGGKCLCNSGYLNSTTGSKCLRRATQLEDKCEEKVQCTELEMNADCVADKCQCNGGFIGSSDKMRCLKMASSIGEDCEDIQQCSSLSPENSNGALCVSNKCMCNSVQGFVGSSSGQECLKRALELLAPCKETVQCSDIGNGDTNSVCSSGVCSCPQTFIPNSEKLKCLKVATNLEDPCEEISQCLPLGNATYVDCTDKKCMCKSGFFSSEDKKSCTKDNSNGVSGLTAATMLLFFTIFSTRTFI